MKSGTPGFVGARLREAREAREMTAISLADLLGVSRQAVSQYENGAQTPAPEVMRRISEILRVPYHFFLAPASPDEAGIFFYRSLESTTKVARLRATRRYGWLRAIAGYVRGLVKFPAVNFPDFGMTSDPRRISEDDIERVATDTRRYWGLQDNAISNVAWLVENNGALLSRFELGTDKMDAFSHWGDADGAPYFVLGSDKNNGARSRFDVSHELGHMVLHRNVSGEKFNDRAIFKLIEEQAHRFAGAFLLPQSTFTKDMVGAPTLDEFVSLKAKWKVSIQGMIMRCFHLGIISSDHRAYLFARLSKKGWRQAEPLDDRIPVEQPRLLRRSIELLIERHVIAPSEMPFRLRLNERDIEELAGLEPGYFRHHEKEPPATLRFQFDDEPTQARDVGGADVIRFPWNEMG